MCELIRSARAVRSADTGAQPVEAPLAAVVTSTVATTKSAGIRGQGQNPGVASCMHAPAPVYSRLPALD